MGILGLSRLISDVSPESVKEMDLKSLFGRKIAIDASMCIYQFLIAIRSQEYAMTNDSGETTSHLVGMFYRSIKMMELGIKPVYVFDGKAPKLKCGELAKRAERRQEAKKQLEEAKEVQNVDDIQRFNKRLVRVTGKIISDSKKLLELLGLPVIQAPSEAEAQCVQLCKEGLVYAVATEDMDALTFGCPRLIRNLTQSNVDKVKEYQIDKVLNGMDLTQEQFIDLSILMGCDYCSNIKGIGGKKGLDLIRKHKNIEGILEEKFDIHEFTEVDIEYDIRGKKEQEKKENDENESKIREEINEDVKAEIKAEDEEEKTKVKEDIKEESKEEVKEGLKEEIKEESKEEVKEELKEDIKEESKEKIKSEQESDEENDDENENSYLQEEINEDNDEDYEEDNKDDDEDDDNDETSEKKNEKKSTSKNGKKGYSVPDNWPFRGARKLFQEPLVARNEFTEKDLRLKKIDEEGLVEFLCNENGFNEERVRNAIKRAKDSSAKSAQTRIDTFFKAKPVDSSKTPNKGGQKRGSSGADTKGTKKSFSNAKRGKR